MEESVWRKETDIAERPALEGNCQTEIVVIGAGMAGILIAYFLTQAGREVIVLEADRIAGGETGDTTAKITSQHGRIYDTLIKNYGESAAGLYARANETAVAAYQRLIEEQNIECQFQKLPAYLYSTSDEQGLKSEAKAADSLGLDAYFTKVGELPFETVGAVCFENQAQFQPLAFIRELAQKVTVYEKTEVLSVSGHHVRTGKGTVHAEHIVFATHYPFTNVPGFYFLRQHQERSYVLAVKNADEIKGMYYSMDAGGISLRQTGELLLIGGGGHRTGKQGDNIETGYTPLRKFAEKYYPDSKEAARWSAQDCIPHDELPLIGRYSVFRPYWYVATGFKKWGMTAAMLSAMIIRDQICGVKNPYEKLFTPQRFHLRAGIGPLLEDIGVSTAGLIKGAFHMPFASPASLKPGQGKIVRAGLRRYGCYKTKEGKIYKVSVRCPHMGCELQWNPKEYTWDCPCHGSRFDYEGKLLDNPAQKNVK